MCGRRCLGLAVLVLVFLLAAPVAARGKRRRNNKPGRALFDRLTSTTLSEVSVASEFSGSLVPPPLDVAPYSSIEANATCGSDGAEEYCRETPGKRGVVCEVCEGMEGSPSRRHPASHAVDGDSSSWWQSPTLAAGSEYQHVELVITLPDKMELLHVIIKSGPSPRPLAWSLEVSPSSGEDWRMIRAFGDRDHCRKLWDLRPERRRRKARAAKRTSRADKPTCSTQFASPRPLENGEMHVAVGEGVVARKVRVSFRAAHASPPRQQYYAVRGITLAARCLCHGQADSCEVNSQGARCACTGNACGRHCDRACATHTGVCAHDDTGAELCFNCTDNRAGPLCDRCLFGFYNALSDGPCESCDCNPEGSDGSCSWNRKHHRISCNCLLGYSGHRCNICDNPDSCGSPGTKEIFRITDEATENTPTAIGTEIITIVTETVCKCDPRGIVEGADVCDDPCQCRPHVVGARCDACAAGHYGLEVAGDAGCRPCYCSHIADSCTLDTEFQPRDIILPMGEGWLVTDSLCNETVEPSIDEQTGKPFVISYEVEGWEYFYWVTSSFSGEQFHSYGAEIRVQLYWGIVRGDTGGNPTFGPDVIVIGADGKKFSCANSSHETPGELVVSVPLLEGHWYTLVDGEDPELVSRTQLMDVLKDVKEIMIRGHYHFDQDEVRLESAEILGPTSPVSEKCACPRGYGGVQCASCTRHYVRASGGTCLPCACNNHADCDTVDGPCGPCQHNTTGPNCERCLPGHYGNPVQGACKPCACPLYITSNNFSPNCVLASAEGDDYVCTQCPDGYSGDHCENCDFGYWGSPTTPGGSCLPCACGGSPCHPATGECLTCPDNTEGAKCDLCKEGYWWGNNETDIATGAVGGCVPCACGEGALSAACDASTGACACRRAWVGRACDTCAPGHGDVSAGCPTCRCGSGAVSPLCAPDTGECACCAGAAPPHCDTCLDLHYGLDSTGCKGCNCSTIGSESNVCDIRSGQCRCREHVSGRTCDTCEEGYWGLERSGCKRCSCGAGAAACDPVTGECACAAGVGGAQCDRCLPGFYGFSPTGCLPCPKCTDGKVCSPVSGRCVCPAGAHGAGCRQCARGYYTHADGCRQCTCANTAINNVCDHRTGQCPCRVGYTGLSCDSCAPGHYGSRCKPCACDPDGTRSCKDGVCPCDKWGRCTCKENVVGEKCNACLDGTFGLSAENPAGCTACFCFGRAARCEQATLARAALHAAKPTHLTLLRADRDAITNMDQDSLLAIHTHSTDATITLPWPPVPVYMELDQRFLGDRVTSYGGVLRFRLEEEGGTELGPETLAKFPLVRLYGRNIVLDYFEHVPAVNNTHAVRLHESLWQVRGATRRRGSGATYAAASRGALMLALMRVDRILLRATTRAPAVDDPVHALLLNVSLDTALPGLSRSAPALGVELCACPRQYAASSCQEPAVGFWMPNTGVQVTSVAGTIVINMEGEAQPCNCNGRATQCDPITGDCLNCTMGTGGPRCATCAAGWYGAPDAGGCRRCPCPAPDRSHAAACRHTHGRIHCYCKPGYTGSECSACADGYYAQGEDCVPCACDSRGAVTSRCDARGICECRSHAAGDKCDQCRAGRTYLDDGGCKPCDNCTLTLLDSVESLTTDLRTRANPTELSRIPKPFPAVRQFAHNATTFHEQLLKTKHNLEHSRNFETTISRLEEIEHRIFTEANRLKTEALPRAKEAEYLNLESMSSLEEVLKQRRKLGEQVAELDDFARGEKHLSAHRALKEARHLLRQIKDTKLSDYYASANDVFDLANVQSTSVHEYKYRIEHTNRRLQQLMLSLNEWERKAADLPQLAGVVWRADDDVMMLKDKVKPRMARVKDTGLRCRLILEDVTNLQSRNLTDDIGASILRAQALSFQLPSLAAELEVLTLATEEKEGILYNLTPSYREKYLNTVEKHVAELAEKAKEYKSLFAGTRAAASRGVSAAHAWAEVAQGVKDAQVAAVEAARQAHAAASLARGPNSMIRQAIKGVNASGVLARKGAELLKKVDGLRTSVDSVSRGAELVRVLLRGAGWAERELPAPRARVRHILDEADAHAQRLYTSTRALYDEASDIRSKIRYNLRRQLAELQKHGDTALGAAQEHVSQIRGDTARGAATAEALAAAAAARAKQHATAAVGLSPALAALKEKLKRARDAADTISVSVTSVFGAGAGCSRAFSVWSASGAVTRLALAVSIENVVRDGPLLHVVDNTQEKERYMKLLIVNRRLIMTWNLGSGSGVILHPEVLQPTHDDADHTSYRIEIERIWNIVQLVVERAGGSRIAASNSTGPNSVRLVPTALWLGAAPTQGAGPTQGAVAHAGLPGCVHALYVDDMTLGLWNFHHQPKEAKCTGCTQRWYGVGRGSEPAMAWFDGGGYAALRRSRLRPTDTRQLSIAFTFRTTDKNALLFAAVDSHNNRSVSVVLESCRVSFIVQYSGARLRISAGGRHCDGKPAHVQAIRVFAGNRLEKGSLRVNGEETLGSPSPPVHSAAALPSLDEYWAGGMPPGAPPEATALLAHHPPLLGCLGALSVDRETYDLLDAPKRHGVEPGCSVRIMRSALLEGTGYIELPSPLFRRKATLGASFLARGKDGLLLYRAPSGDNEVDDGDDKHYLALVMKDGELELLAAAGKSELRLRTNGTRFDDKNMHTVRIVRLHKQLEVWVDESQVLSGVLSGNAYPARDGGLYVGGVEGGQEEGARRRGVPVAGFNGVVADLIVDSQLIGFERAVRWEDAGLGRGAERMQAPRRSEPRALHAQGHSAGCTKSPSYSVEGGAVKFGDGWGSHATMRVRRARRLALAAQIRTYRDGLLMLIPGTKNKPKHYAALVVREGRVRLVVRGRKRKELALNTNVTDGVWRTVSISISRSRVELSCGAETTGARAPPLARAQRIYVGGIPPALPNVPNALSRLGGFRGCVRRVSVNGRFEDLVQNARDHAHVGQCFPNVEPAAYFGGDAYATWSAQYPGGASGEVSMRFRTTEPSGVLLSSPGLLLEIADGIVVATRRGAGSTELSRVSGTSTSCSGTWEHVHVSWRGARLSLRVGTAPALPALAAPPLLDLDQAPLEAGPLYLAGLPEGTIDTSESAGKANFKGCITDVTINGQTKDWTEMESLHNVLLDSCPISSD